jgi:carboxylate-amine ligase
MPLKDPSFSIGIEEEYLLVEQASRDLVREMPPALFEAAQQALQGQVAREFLKSQIEVGTGVHSSAGSAGRELGELRRTVARLAGEHGLAPIAASTHPFARRSGTATRRSPAISPASAAGSSSAACTCTSASRTTSCAST